ncbi:MAG: DUF6314 family protein [Solirubrobacteraceae bacterium]
MRADDTLAYLAGAWSLERRLVDHRAGLAGSFVGEAEVVTAERAGRYEERGRLRFDGYDGPAHRALDLTAAGAAVTVSFTDGRPFFLLDLAPGGCSAVHVCRADRYELEFELGGRNLLLERWRVTGPAKHYEARTTWERQRLNRPERGRRAGKPR